MKKAEIRKIYIEKRKNLTNSEVEEKSKNISSDFFKNTNLTNVSVAHIFIPIENFNEVQTWQIIKLIWKYFPHIKTATSITTKEELKHVLIDANTVFSPDDWGIPVPQNGVEIEAKAIDIVITPLLAFDKNLHRVGYGKGYYDKFFAKCRNDVQKIGVSFFPPLEDEIEDINEYDVVLDNVIWAS